jgi:hypothetical protein
MLSQRANSKGVAGQSRLILSCAQYDHTSVECKQLMQIHSWTWLYMKKVSPSSSSFCKKHTSILIITFLSDHYGHLATDMANGGTEVFKTTYIPVWFRCKPPYKLLLYGYSLWLPELPSAVYTCHPRLLLAWQICRTYSPISLAPLLLLGDFIAWLLQAV